MPSPTRTITPAQSPIQAKRKLENTVSTENATGVALKKKDKLSSTQTLVGAEQSSTIVEEEPTPMETEDTAEDLLNKEQIPPASSLKTISSRNFSVKDIQAVGDLCEQLIQDQPTQGAAATAAAERYSPEKELVRQLTSTKLDTIEDSPEKTKGATKVIKKFVNKHKTADLVNVIGKIDAEESAKAAAEGKPKAAGEVAASGAKPFVRKCSLQDESPLNKFSTERRKSRILETAEKFQQMNAAAGGDKPKKLVIPGVSVGNYKKEYERKASTGGAATGQQLTAGERRALEEVAAAAAASEAAEAQANIEQESNVEASDSKASVSSFSLEDARKSMENSIALLRQAQSESSKDLNNLSANAENIFDPNQQQQMVGGGGSVPEREQQLKNARTIIGNAIQPGRCYVRNLKSKYAIV